MKHGHKISFFKGAKAANPTGVISLEDFISEVRDGTHRAKVERIRAEQDEDQRGTLKQELKAVTLSGKVVSGGRAKAMEDGRFDHSGFLQIDLDADDLQEQPPEVVRDVLAEDRHIIAAFISPSGSGVKAVMLVPSAATKDEHTATFRSAERYMADNYALQVDKATKDPVRFCYVSFDPEARWNSEAVPLEILAPRAAPAPEVAMPSTTSPSLKLGASVGFPQPPREGIHAWIMEAAWHCRANGMSEADTAAKLHGYDGTLRRRYQPTEVVDAVHKVFSSATGDRAPTDKTVDPAQAETLRERAYRMRFDALATPPPDETCMSIGGIPIAARGNLTVPQGKSKVGKSAVISAILGAANRGNYAAVGDTLKIEWEGTASGAIVHLDTEQSLADWHALVCRGITRSGLPEASNRLVSLPLIPFTRSERLAILRATLEFEKARLGSIDLVLIDGIADLCTSPNDEAEGLELVSKVHALAQEFHCAVFCVLHENPSSDIGKTRGHLGSELNRKAFANLRIDKDTETSVSTIYGSDMRKQDIPKEHGFCFAWDEVKQMHTFQGRAAGLKASQKEQKQVAEFREQFEPIYEHASNGTEIACPVLSPIEVRDIEQDMNGTEKPASEAAWKKRMQRAEMLGVLRKGDRGKWSLTRTGQTGQERDRDS